MPETMSPREKDVQERVEKIVFEKFYGGPLSGSKERLAAALIAEFNLASLASSGDHAELALNAKAAQTWALGIYENRDQAARRSEFIDSDLPATILALIAEVAALRGAKWEVQHVDTMNDMVLMGMARDDAEARATEAERKLAEAVGLLTGLCIGTPTVKVRAAREWLSKEAERG